MKHMSIWLPLWLLEAATLQPPRLLEGHSGDVTRLTWSPDGAFLAGGCNWGDLRIWETTGWATLARQHAHLPMPTKGMLALARSPDMRFLVSAGADGVVRLWGAP